MSSMTHRSKLTNADWKHRVMLVNQLPTSDSEEHDTAMSIRAGEP